MSKKYNFKEIEKRWQRKWLEEKVFRAREDSKKPKYYQLETFPYPSAAGLHVGHPKGYIAEDIHARYMRMHGKEVLYTMGWDAFGLPTENYAIKVGKSPQEVAEANIKNFRRQVQMFGFSYDWDRELNTSSPEYYKWTQWLFIKLWEKGLAYRKKATVNWCPKDQTVLANEQVVGGRCERCESLVEQKEMEQWFFRITDYAERLLNDLNNPSHPGHCEERSDVAIPKTSDGTASPVARNDSDNRLITQKDYCLSWPEASIKRQKDWIGRSEGAELDFEVKTAEPPNFVLLHGYGGSPEKNFFPWLKKELEEREYKVQVPLLPHSDKARANEKEDMEVFWKTVKLNKDTVLVGHSLGTIVAMKAVEKLKIPIRKLVLVGGFLEPRFRDRERAFAKTFDWKFDFEKIRANVRQIVALHDINDVAIPYDQGPKLRDALRAELIESTPADTHFTATIETSVLQHSLESITVFTTRPDTLFGATYMVLAPEHPLIANSKGQIANWKEIEEYIKEAKHKTELQRQEGDPSTDSGHSKTGVELKGVKAINPATKEEIPIWVADYVLSSYGTGAIMAVPAHDERDCEFAKKFGLPIRQVIAPFFEDEWSKRQDGHPSVMRKTTYSILRNPKTDEYLVLDWGKFNWHTFLIGGVEGNEDFVGAAAREIREETGYRNTRFIKSLGRLGAAYFAAHKKENRIADAEGLLFELVDESREEVSGEEKAKHEMLWLKRNKVRDFINLDSQRYIWQQFLGESVYTGVGMIVNSDKFDGMDSEKAKWEITKLVGGRRRVQYRLRDWSVSRQRYWGCPIPMVHCKKCGLVSVPEKDLPVKLPPLKNYRPKGVPPLASSKEFISVKCPKCGGEAKRDPETLDTFVDSSWYFLRYVDPHNDKEFASKEKLDYWLGCRLAPPASLEHGRGEPKPCVGGVDLYIIGAEHTTMHLLYARFVTKFLHDIGCVNFVEPFMKLRHQGLLLGEDGQKMSKRYGNVVNPDDIIGEFGADTIRLYEMFMGPFEDAQPWSSNGVLGVHRFLNRVWKFYSRIFTNLSTNNTNIREISGKIGENSRELERLLHKTIKKVGEDIENLRFNTAVSALMILLNEMEKQPQSLVMSHELFVKILHPFAPHLAQELWSQLEHDTYLDFEPWPEYDPRLIVEDKITLVIQVNGKVRDSVEAPADIDETAAKELALGREKVKRFLGGKEPKKVIYVKGKLINIVVE